MGAQLSGPAAAQAAIGDDFVQTFQIEGMNVRGRIVRLGAVSDRVLSAHGYPHAVSRLVGEGLVLTALLGASLKFNGILTLQTRSSGPVRMVVADYTSPGTVRACASFETSGSIDLDGAGPDAAALFGEGSFALTIDQGEDMERYQGVVPLAPGGLGASALEYFSRSEQIPTALQTAVAPVTSRDANGRMVQQWRAGGILIQNLAELGGHGAAAAEDPDEAWNRAAVLLNSVEAHELVDPQLDANRLLYRLFHEDGVRVFGPQALAFGCRCSPDRVGRVLSQYTPEDLDDLIEDGVIKATCEFCSTQYRFDPATLHDRLSAG